MLTMLSPCGKAAELQERIFCSASEPRVVMESSVPLSNEKKAAVSGPQASFSSCLADLADNRSPRVEMDDRSGAAGKGQMAACMSPGPRLAARRRTKIASFFSERKRCEGPLEGGVVGCLCCGGRGGKVSLHRKVLEVESYSYLKLF